MQKGLYFWLLSWSSTSLRRVFTADIIINCNFIVFNTDAFYIHIVSDCLGQYFPWKDKQIKRQGTTLSNTSLDLKEIAGPDVIQNAAFRFTVKSLYPLMIYGPKPKKHMLSQMKDDSGESKAGIGHPRRPQPAPSLSWTPPSRQRTQTRKERARTPQSPMPSPPPSPVPASPMNQDDLRRQLQLLLNDQRETSAGRRIAGIATTYKDGGSPFPSRTSSRVFNWKMATPVSLFDDPSMGHHELKPDILQKLYSLYNFYHKQWWCHRMMYYHFKRCHGFLNSASLFMAVGMIVGSVFKTSIIVTVKASAVT